MILVIIQARLLGVRDQGLVGGRAQVPQHPTIFFGYYIFARGVCWICSRKRSVISARVQVFRVAIAISEATRFRASGFR